MPTPEGQPGSKPASEPASTPADDFLGAPLSYSAIEDAIASLKAYLGPYGAKTSFLDVHPSSAPPNTSPDEGPKSTASFAGSGTFGASLGASLGAPGKPVMPEGLDERLLPHCPQCDGALWEFVARCPHCGRQLL
jgi:hypothetical protein